MPTRAKGLVRTVSSLAHGTEPEIYLLPILINIIFECLTGNAVRVAPAIWVPSLRLSPDLWVHLRDDGGREDVISFWDDEVSVFRRRGQGGRDRNVFSHVSHDTMNGRVDTKGFANDGVHHWEFPKFLVGHRAKFPVGGSEVLHLFLVEFLPADVRVSVKNRDGY